MSEYCHFTLKGAGPPEQAEAFAAHWNGLLRDVSDADSTGFTFKIVEHQAEFPEVPQQPVAYYDDPDMGCVVANGLVRIWAASNWRPPLELIEAMSARWPDMEFVLSCTVEHVQFERWHIQAGESAIIDLQVDEMPASEEDDDPTHYYVQNGDLAYWPDWHPVQWVDKVVVHSTPEWFVALCRYGVKGLERATEEIVGFYDGDDRKQ